MKILMVTGPVHPVPPIKGAAVETWMYEVSKRLIGFEPHIVSISHPFYPEREYRDGIYFHRIRFGRLYRRLFQKITKLDPLSYERRILRIIDGIKPEIVHIHNYAPIDFIEGVRRRGIKTILHMHNEKDVGSLKVDLFIGCSNYILDLYRKKGKIDADFKVVYNGVDLGRFRPLWEVKELRRRIRERFGIGEDRFVALYVGRVSPEKGVEHFMRSAMLLKDRKDMLFVIAGEISTHGERGRYGEEIMRMARALGDRCIYAGLFPPSKVHLAYLLGDVVIIPSNFEDPFPMVPIEAMATGLPVIVRRRGGMKEYIVDGENGLSIGDEAPGNDIAEKVRLLYEKRDLREKIGKAARETVEERFSWEKITNDAEGLYHGLLKG